MLPVAETNVVISTANISTNFPFLVTDVVATATTISTAVSATTKANASVFVAGALVKSEKNTVNSHDDDDNVSGAASSGINSHSSSNNNNNNESSVSHSESRNLIADSEDEKDTIATVSHQQQHHRQRISAVKVTPPSTNGKVTAKSTKIEMPAGLNYVFDTHLANKHHHHDYR